MAIAERVRRLRQERGWSQVELGEKISAHQKQISSYERGVNVPSVEILVKLAEVFGVTLDYLAFDNQSQAAKINIQDRELLRRFEAVDSLPEPYRSLAKEVLDLLILKHRFQELVTTGPLRSAS